ncbi:MAG: 3-deoxy-D-manno-octulosonic acid transferase [Halodesulfovibrio sp.]
MTLSFSNSLLLKAYSSLWPLLRPVLERNKRLRHGLHQRLVPDDWASKADVWVQAASGGEAYLSWELLRHLPEDRGFNLLLTTCTLQGMEVLERAKAWCAEERPRLNLQLRYFPFDKPALMRKAMRLAAPRAVVLLETELWPGLLAASDECNVPVAVLNGRMTTRSLAGYLATPSLWKGLRPQTVLAISENDARRFASLFGEQSMHVMHNMKFDRVQPADPSAPNPLQDTVIKENTSLVTLGSVRMEEEAEVQALIRKLREARPKTSIALIPRHMERVVSWEAWLRREGIPMVRRSAADAPPAPGTVILWDEFGELNHVYALSRAVFVGGSLAPLGGQNFLEPLAFGINPVIGPSYGNFAWAAGLIDEKMVHVAADTEEVFEQLLRNLKRPAPRDKVQGQFAEWLSQRQGGSAAAVHALLSMIK